MKTMRVMNQSEMNYIYGGGKGKLLRETWTYAKTVPGKIGDAAVKTLTALGVYRAVKKDD